MAYFQNWRLFDKLQLLTSNNQKIIINGSILLALLISFFLISKSLYVDFNQYQQYYDAIGEFREVDLTFNRELLKSRYELFANYDPLVRSLAKKKAIQKKLQKIPNFVTHHEKQKIELILKEIRAVIAKKEDLHERFKTQNALLKNSLRYLPILTDNLEKKLDAKEQTIRLAQGQIDTLKNTLNSLIRNLLLYNIAVDKKLTLNIDNLMSKFSQLQLQYELTEDEFPSQLVKAHANVILTTKPKIEELTTQLLQSLEQNTKALEATVESSYQQAAVIVNQYRLLTCGWFLMLLILVNYLLIKRKRWVDPEFSKYKKQVGEIAAALEGMSTSVNSSSDAEEATGLVNLWEREDELGQLARGVREIATQANKRSIVTIDESSASLRARLTLLTKNRKNFISPLTLEQLEIIIGDALDNWNCKMIDFQGSLEQVQILFTYPPQIQLSQLVTHLKTVSAAYFYEKLQDIMENTDEVSQIWCDSSSITSCEG
ncbi:MAG: transposase [Calothrix sp. MO_167.B12]|nr:transposase [Calothrix sp. MO_167.B12]